MLSVHQSVFESSLSAALLIREYIITSWCWYNIRTATHCWNRRCSPLSHNLKALIAYIGIDSSSYQSITIHIKSRGISKRGFALLQKDTIYCNGFLIKSSQKENTITSTWLLVAIYFYTSTMQELVNIWIHLVNNPIYKSTFSLAYLGSLFLVL